MPVLQQLYKSSLVLLTDFYQLTMAYGYWQAKRHEHEAVFYYSFRKSPFGGGYAVFAGLGTLIEFLNQFQFTKDDLEFLRQIKNGKDKPIFNQAFLQYLAQLQFTCEVHAVPEGSVVFPHEPLLRIQGPLLQCQLIESLLLNVLNFQTLIATSAARLLQATRGEPVLEFGLRRAQGFDGALMASRAAYIGGCVATSNTLASKLYGIPLKGTHAHSWVLSFDSELEAFRNYAKIFSDHCIFLVDTYDTLQGVQHAIRIADELTPQGFHFAGIRLDSGDLAYLSKKARKLLDKAGYNDAIIVGSNDLNPLVIASLKEQSAKINVWGVGTHLITAYDQPALDGVYKLSAIRSSSGSNWEYKVKLSEQALKTSTPGLLAVRRYFVDQQCQHALADVIYDTGQGINESATIIDPLDATRRRIIPSNASYRELMQPIFKNGKCIYKLPSLESSQALAKAELNSFHTSIRRLLNPHHYPVGFTQALYDLKLDLILKARGF